MKEIKAVVRPNKLAALRSALVATPGFPGMTVSKVDGCSAPYAPTQALRIKEELTDFSSKIKLEIVAPDEVVDALYNTIVQVAMTGHLGDGLIWVTDVDRATFLHKTSGGPT